MKNLFRILYYLKSYLKFKKKGGNLIFGSNGKFIRPQEISLGNNIFIASNFHISARNLEIGNDVMIGPSLIIECDDHIYNQVGKTMFSISNNRKGSFVKIENDVWIGANVVILKNVTIGEGCIIGASSLVNKDLPPYTICVGLPCKPVNQRFTKEELVLHLQKIKSSYSVNQIVETWENKLKK